MIWRVRDRAFSLKPNVLELELEGSVLNVRYRGRSFQFDLARPSVEMTMHHFAPMRGSILRLRSGSTEVTVAGEAYAATDSPYADEPLKDSQFFLSKTEFETFHRALADVRRAASPLAASDPSRQRRSFLLRGNANVYRVAAAAVKTGAPGHRGRDVHAQPARPAGDRAQLEAR
jgi:hypothetical protein